MFAGGKASYGLAKANMKVEYMSECGSLEKDYELFNELIKSIETAKSSI